MHRTSKTACYTFPTENLFLCWNLNLTKKHSSKLFEHRSKTRHCTPLFIHSDWQICETNNLHWVWIRHLAKVQHFAPRIMYRLSCSTSIINGSSLFDSCWIVIKITFANLPFLKIVRQSSQTIIFRLFISYCSAKIEWIRPRSKDQWHAIGCDHYFCSVTWLEVTTLFPEYSDDA